MHGFRTQPLPWGKRTLGRDRMDQPPREPENDEYQDEQSKGDVNCHGGTGFHAAMNVGHQPADQILHEQKRYDEPVEQLRGGPVCKRSVMIFLMPEFEHSLAQWKPLCR